MDLLVFLVQRRGELVRREEIVEKLWGSATHVEVDASINAAIRKIRAALKDDPSAPVRGAVLGKAIDSRAIWRLSAGLSRLRGIGPPL